MNRQNAAFFVSSLLKTFAGKIVADPFFAAVCGFCILAVCIVFFAVAIQIGRKIGRLESERNVARLLKANREDAIKRSRAVIGGQMAEQVAPFLAGFPCNPADARFVGKPVDFIAFPGAAEGKPVSEILFIEVKTGSSLLSKREKEVKEAVCSGRVRYVEYTPADIR